MKSFEVDDKWDLILILEAEVQKKPHSLEGIGEEHEILEIL